MALILELVVFSVGRFGFWVSCFGFRFGFGFGFGVALGFAFGFGAAFGQEASEL